MESAIGFVTFRLTLVDGGCMGYRERGLYSVVRFYSRIHLELFIEVGIRSRDLENSNKTLHVGSKIE
jgi:hypothetical protein